MHEALAGREGVEPMVEFTPIVLVAQQPFQPQRMPEAAIIEIDVADGERGDPAAGPLAVPAGVIEAAGLSLPARDPAGIRLPGRRP